MAFDGSHCWAFFSLPSAVCGIDEDDDEGEGHAVVMAKLARDFVEKFNEIIAVASPEDDVSRLRLRVGVCSGSIT
jgi:hypothetical protein